MASIKLDEVNALAPIPVELRKRLESLGAKRWLITGCAGFIGSNLVENLLLAGQSVVGIDNFATGLRSNIKNLYDRLGVIAERNFEFYDASICDPEAVSKAVKGCQFVSHQAALGSVPRSIKTPMATYDGNVTGFVTVLDSARLAGVSRFVYASSSSVYGDHPDLPKTEDKVGKVLSPYAATKAANELFANVYRQCYGLRTIGLRYFNVFGPRQDPEGAYAAVIPRWIASLIRGESPVINGDGETSRDFCFVANAVQANILAAIADERQATNHVFNVAFQQQTSLNQLLAQLKILVSESVPKAALVQAKYVDFRDGDIRHSLADISAISNMLGYKPEFDLKKGLDLAMPWYLSNVQ
jgi:UDP-N-acetylglucosamine/UDP-N-acetylgalactosamine 4-epimerase